MGGGPASPVPALLLSSLTALQSTVTEPLVFCAVNVWRAMRDRIVRDVPLVTTATL